MIVTRLQAGLGNQMFQYAAGLALAERHRTVLKIDPSWYHYDPLQEQHNKYSLNCFNITEQFATEDEVERLKGRVLSRTDRILSAAAALLKSSVLTRLCGQKGSYHIDDGSGFSPRFLDLPDNTYIEGLWQSEKYFKSAAEAIRLHFSFRYPVPPEALEVEETIRRCKRAVAVHFRRGDYVRTANYFNEVKLLPPEERELKERDWLERIGPNLPLSLEYYHKAVEYLKKMHGEITLFVFSDDISAVAKEFQPTCRHYFVGGNFHAHDTMRLMSLCDDNVIANSSFSWWAAWLNSCKSKTVIAPRPWHQGENALENTLVPEDWIRIPARTGD